MSRLTKRKTDGTAWYNHTVEREVKNGDILEKLAHYEDLEEAGRLIELPCKVGDTVYFPLKYKHNSAIINCIQIEKHGIFVYWEQYETGVDVTELWDEGSFEISAIGKTVFLTKAEAEANLAELKGE